MSELGTKIIAVHRALDDAQLPHAFGGALALAWCTAQARGTNDIDVNVFVDAGEADALLRALPDGVAWGERDRDLIRRNGQCRLFWGSTPLDLFLNTTDFHAQAAERVRVQDFGDVPVPFLSCLDLAVFKAFFNRPRDWADLHEMRAAGTLDVDRVVGILTRYLGTDDERIASLRALDS
jgi:hypothetical protein